MCPSERLPLGSSSLGCGRQLQGPLNCTGKNGQHLMYCVGKGRADERGPLPSPGPGAMTGSNDIGNEAEEEAGSVLPVFVASLTRQRASGA